ncbi:class I SAM-dependent methyltransferase [Aeoliella mucimassa]|uniref:Demethylrebeccamycin-D-glucose O-methyltransferase n=1 Tax=Aeoliella mucimassa TaxID=2527972 RepID=A0A518AML6_9BACT|nr:class I SAM-dependent methyltransferase [Aeoliella mucimassa]QDU55970.1 Demethylrebeccamycin-D-glucose O-methyltransferase [Aeoliella mucimassa]
MNYSSIAPVVPAVANIVDLPLDQALALVEKAFDTESIRARQIAADEVVEYYRQSERAYRMFHSGAGALHIGMRTSDAPADANDKVGHRRHVELFAEQLDAIDAKRAIEFGCGMGFNVRSLAEQFADREFVGVDLSPHHLRSARRDAKGLANVEFVEANYQQLSFSDGSFDALLAIETLCQTDDQQLALAEAYRVLRPGGRMMVIDCFRNQPLESFDAPLQQAARLVEKTAAVDAFAVMDSWQAMATSLGFSLVSVVDRSADTATDLARLYRLSRRFFNMSLAVKLIRRTMPPLAVENAICGLLMPYTVGYSAHGYYSVVLEKPASVGN